MAEVYRAERIGGVHGVSCVFPRLQDIIDYEDGVRAPDQGYPRFVQHPLVKAVCDLHRRNGEFVFATDSYQSAEFVRRLFARSEDRQNINTLQGNNQGRGYGILTTPDKDAAEQLHIDLRNLGFTLSSRKAQRILGGVNLLEDRSLEHSLRAQLSLYEKGSACNARAITFYPSGMAAVTTSFLAALRENPGDVLMVGSPYVDTRLLVDKLPSRLRLPHTRNVTFVEVDADFTTSITSDTGIVFVELPTNPLVRIPDLEKILTEARKKDALVIVDSTIATPLHFNPLEYGADIVVHSTTKALNGGNDHLGGALLINPSTRYAGLFEAVLNWRSKELAISMDPAEQAVLYQNIQSFTERAQAMSITTGAVATYLAQHPAVRKVWYPGLISHPDHTVAKTSMHNGYGHLLSFELEGSNLERARIFYDHCTLEGKGPSLGSSNPSLLCPITIFTFHKESDDFLRSIKQDRYLMRYSGGVGPPSADIDALATGLNLL